MMGTPRNGDKSAIQNTFNSTMMASFVPIIVSKKNKQTDKSMFFIVQCLTNSHKS